MIAHLRGKLVSRTEESIVIDVNGVGYEVFACGAAFSSLEFGKEVSVIVYTDVRETAIVLFGFSNEQEKQVFLLLKKVQKIGSKLALSIVSAVGAEGVLQGIGQQDVAFFTRVPGIGKKTAERIIVELREQVGALVGSGIDDDIIISRRDTTPSHNAFDGSWAHVGNDAVLALEKLGFAGDRARTAVKQAIASEGESNPALIKDAGELLRSALANL